MDRPLECYSKGGPGRLDYIARIFAEWRFFSSDPNGQTIRILFKRRSGETILPGSLQSRDSSHLIPMGGSLECKGGGGG